jgi:ABC-type multidrug transport system ATPase subunit
LFGPIGSGKSTLLKVISQEVEADEGIVRWDGQPAGKHAFVIQQDPTRTIAADLTLRENLTIARNQARMWRFATTDDRDASSICSKVDANGGLAVALDRPVRSFSGGQIQLVAVACAIASSAPVILADEPTKMLDAIHARRVEQALKALAQERIVIVTAHHPRPDLAPLTSHFELIEGQLQAVDPDRNWDFVS